MSWFNKNNPDDEQEFYEADDGYIDDSYSETDFEKELANAKMQKSTKKLLLAIAYGIFLLIGICSTSFVTNEEGTKKAQVVTVEIKKERASYNQMKAQYLVLYKLMIQIEEVDQRLMNTSENGVFKMATEYENFLPTIDQNLPTAKALEVSPKYGSLKNQLLTVYDDASIYLQKMSSALSNKNVNTLKEAISWKQQMNNDFELLKENMGVFATMVKIEDPDFTSDINIGEELMDISKDSEAEDSASAFQDMLGGK